MTALLATGLVVLALALSMIGGAIVGVWMAGRHFGGELSALIGALYGPAAVLPAIGLGLLVFALIGS